MATTKKEKKDDHKPMDAAMHLGMALAGGIGANLISNFAEKQAFMQGKEDFVPLIPMGLGALGYIFLPKEFRMVALGAFVVAGTEEAEHLLAKTGIMSGLPMGKAGMGFTPQYLPTQAMQQASVKTANGVVVR